jgi:hypothetical protein
MHHHPAIDHHIVHHQPHPGRVRIVANDDVAWAQAEMSLLFPHESVMSTSIGCCHQCVYTDHASSSLIAERIAEHLVGIRTRGDREPLSRAESEGRHVSSEPSPDFFGLDSGDKPR